jgi:hypothetical protein
MPHNLVSPPNPQHKACRAPTFKHRKPAPSDQRWCAKSHPGLNSGRWQAFHEPPLRAAHR